VFLPGVSFELGPDGGYTPTLRGVKRLAAVCTYGGSRWRTILMGDPPRRVVKRSLRALIDRRARCDYLAHYDMNHTTPERRRGFLGQVRRAFERW
jgi:NAD(P)H dehydrogenase (quinone)